jgi:hypothetical protein
MVQVVRTLVDVNSTAGGLAKPFDFAASLCYTPDAKESGSTTIFQLVSGDCE